MRAWNILSGPPSLREIAPRILADMLFLSTALFLAFSTYLVGWVAWQDYPDPERIRRAYSALYVQNV